MKRFFNTLLANWKSFLPYVLFGIVVWYFGFDAPHYVGSVLGFVLPAFVAAKLIELFTTKLLKRENQRGTLILLQVVVWVVVWSLLGTLAMINFIALLLFLISSALWKKIK